MLTADLEAVWQLSDTKVEKVQRLLIYKLSGFCFPKDVAWTVCVQPFPSFENSEDNLQQIACSGANWPSKMSVV